MPEEGNPPITTGVKEHLLQYTTYEATSISREEVSFEIYFSFLFSSPAYLLLFFCFGMPGFTFSVQDCGKLNSRREITLERELLSLHGELRT